MMATAVSSTSWADLRSGEPGSVHRSAEEATELARALAVESLASDAEAELAELDDRRRHLAGAAWPESPLAGFGLESSLGAFVMARIAMAWVPSGHTGLRHKPLSREGLERALAGQGVAPASIRLVLGDWAGPAAGFVGDVGGLPVGTLAGLAEKSLTAGERARALDQVAASPRDLARLVAALLIGQAVRRLLPLLPDDAHGARFAATLALVATDRPERASSLLEARPLGLRERTVRELADAVLTLRRGEPIDFPADAWAPDPPVSPALAPASAEPTLTLEDGEEDVLEIVEERLDPDQPESRVALKTHPPDWWPGPAAELGPVREALARWKTMGHRRGAVLGVRVRLPVGPGPLPLDPRLAAEDLGDALGAPTERIDLENLDSPRPEGEPAELYLPAVRVALRVVARSAEGAFPPDPATGGALEWVFARAAAIASAVAGDLDAAARSVEGLDPALAPERGFIADRRLRFEGRVADPLPVEDARVAAAGLIRDLALSLAATLARGGEPGAPPDDSWDRVREIDG